MVSVKQILAESTEYNLQDSLFESGDIDSLYEHIFEGARDQLDEAANDFKGLPSIWKKITAAAYNATGGENSEVVEVGKRNAIKTSNLFDSTLKRAIEAAKDYVAVWVEMDGEPMAMVIRDVAWTSSRPTFKIVTANGIAATVTKSRKIEGTGEWKQRLQKFVPTRHHQWEEKNLSKEQSYYSMRRIFVDIAEQVYDDSEDDGKSQSYIRDKAYEVFVQGANLSIKGLKTDEVRTALKADRKASKEGMGTADIETRKAMFKKLILSKVSEIQASLSSALPSADDISKAVDLALTGDRTAGSALKAGSIDGVAQKIAKLGAAISRLSELASSDFKYNNKNGGTSGWGDGKSGIQWNASYFLKALKDI